jgi:kinesin family protein 6/9
MAEGASNIDIFLRIKPVQRPSGKLSWDGTEGLVAFNMPRDVTQGYVNNQRENYEFRFDGILTPEAKQDEVGGLAILVRGDTGPRRLWERDAPVRAAGGNWLSGGDLARSGRVSAAAQVFERVARPVVTAALEGYNGTVFAYGQTGSGKTFTITGGAERYVDRGIIPRTISAIFGEAGKRGDYQFEARAMHTAMRAPLTTRACASHVHAQTPAA